MVKNIFQDMVREKPMKSREYEIGELKRIEEQVRREKIKSEFLGRDVKKHHYKIWLVAFASVFSLFFALSFAFTKATITIIPKTEEIILDKAFSAEKSSTGESLSFDLVAISGEEEKDITVNTEQDILKKSEGVIVMYNDFSTTSQVLLIDTQLEGSNGKIYKTKTRIVIPGKTKDGKPGSVEVGIYAKDAGVEYDSAPIDFKILNFKGSPKYAKFYGRSKGPISGGFAGKGPFLSEDDRKSLIGETRLVLEGKLFKEAMEQLPPGFILFKDAVSLSLDESSLVPIKVKDNLFKIKMKGTLYGIIFNEEKLISTIAEASILDYDKSPIYIPDLQNSTFAISNKEKVVFAEVKNISFTLKGNLRVVYKTDTEKLTADLLGKPKKDLSSVLANYPSIASAKLSIRPIWNISIPEEAEKVKIIMNSPR